MKTVNNFIILYNYNYSNGNITKVLQGKRKHHKGWTGKYVENPK